MKKTYIKPQICVKEFQLEGLIAASIQMYKDKYIDTSSQDAQLGNKYTSPWNSTNWE